MLTWPFASVGWVSSLIQRAAASQKRINEFIDIDEKVIDNGNRTINEILKLEFKNVGFKYPNSEEYALKNINFNVKSGESLGVFGKTGSGKSSLAQILCRLYEITNGEILINGISINEIDLKKYREKIGYVPQDVFLFSDSIQSNIAFGLKEKEYNSEDIKIAAEKAGLKSDIEKFKQNYQQKLEKEELHFLEGKNKGFQSLEHS